MRRFLWGALCLFLTQTASHAGGSQMDPRFLASLKRLDAETRLDQVCDYEAMFRLGHDHNNLHPDRAKAEVISKPIRTRTRSGLPVAVSEAKASGTSSPMLAKQRPIR
jgi:hypothetical protein